MNQTLKRKLKRIPFTEPIYRKWRCWRDRVDGKRLFKNHQDYLTALAQKGRGTLILETHDGLKITVRKNLWDARIVREIFVGKPYTQYCNLPKSPVIVDVGGYIGDFSLYAVKYLNARKVVVYEPAAENYEILNQNVANNGFSDRITAVNKAVSNSSAVELNVQIQENDEVHVSAYWYSDAERRVIPSVTLSDILRDHALDSVDLLKVDCEGGEFDIFPSTSNDTYRRIQNVVFEYHPVDGFREKLNVVLNRLRSAGYTLQVKEKIAYAYRTQ